MGFLDELFKKYKSPELNESNSAPKVAPSLMDLYNKYDTGYTPEEADQVSEILRDSHLSSNPGELTKVETLGQKPVNTDMLQAVRPMAGVSANPVMTLPNMEEYNKLSAPKKDLASVNNKEASKSIQPLMPSTQALQAAQQNQAPKEDLMGQLAAAQRAANTNTLGAGMQRAAEQIAGGIGRRAADYSGSESLKAGTQIPVTQLKQKIDTSKEQIKLNDEQEMSDPKSSISMMLRQFAKKHGMNIADNVSGRHIEKMAPYIINAFNAEESRKARLQMSKDAAEAKATAAGEKKTAALDKDTVTRFDKMGKLLTAEVTSGRTSLGQDAQALRAIENAQALIGGTKDLNTLDNRQVYESARVLDRILSGGVGGQHSSAKLTPETARSMLQGLIEKATNKRQGAQLGSFMQSMDDTFSREKALAETRVKKTQNKLLSNFQDLKEKDPEKWHTVMTEHGLISESSKQEGMVKVKAPNGEIKLVPKEHVDEALKSGGILVQ